jgi:CBS domain-containing protein
MFDQSVKTAMRRRGVLKARSSTTVTKAARMMARRNVGAVMVIDDGALVGIFTERDVVFRVVAQGLDPQATRLGDVMTAAPHTIGPAERLGHGLLIMHENGFRHLPVVDRGEVVGVLSARSAMDPDLEEFVSEQNRREYLLGTRRGGTRGAGSPRLALVLPREPRRGPRGAK